MPVWLLVADYVCKHVAGTELSGGWLYVSIVAGALLCAGVVVVSGASVLKRGLFIFASWLLLALEILALGAFELSRSGLSGTQ